MALVLAAAAALAACGGGSSDPGDTTAPTIVVTDGFAGVTATGDVTFTFTFSEDVGASFTAADVTVAGGTKGAFTKVSGTVTTLVMVPTANAAGTLTVSVAAGAVTDLAGNANAAAASGSQAYDTRPAALTQMSLPVSFDAATVNYGLVGFGGAEDSTIVADPTNAANQVAKVVKSATAEVWAGTTVTALDGLVQTGFSSKVPFDAANTRMTVRVYSPTAGIPVRLKVEDRLDQTRSVETEALTTVANAWETLTFDFTVPTVPPTAGLNLAYNYDKASIFFNFGVSGATSGAKTYYFDDVTFIGGVSVDTTPPTVAVTDSVAGAAAAGDVTFTFTFSEDVGSSFIAGDVAVTGGTAGAFAKASATVYTLVVSPPAASTGTLTVDVAAGAFSDLAGNASAAAATASQAFDTTVPLLTQMTLPVTFDSATVDYGLVGFGGAEDATIVADPAGGANQVARVVKSATAESWAGTTITAAGPPQPGFASRIPFTITSTTMTVRVYSPVAGIPVRLKVEEHLDPTKSVETEALTTVANAWETLTFDFTVPTTPPTAALNLAFNYDKASIFFNYGVTGATSGARTYYFDDLAFVTTGGGGGSAATQVVFADDYAAGVAFAGFGGATNAVSVDAAEAHSGAASLRVLVPASGYTGGALVAAAPQDLSAYNAVTFWLKASKVATLNVSGLGDAAAPGPSYKVESLQIPVDGTWTKHVIPIPVSSRLTASQGLFHFAEGAEEGSYTLWIDDVAYVDLSSAELGTPTAANVGWGAAVPVGVGATFGIDSAPNAIAWGPPVTTNGGNLTNVGFRYFTLTSSNPAVATVDGDGVVTGLSGGTTQISAKLGALVVPGVKIINVTAPLGVPSTIAAAPTAAPADVISMFSSTYTNVGVDSWSTDWSACCNTLTDPFDIAGHPVKKYELRHFAGIQFVGANAIDASAMAFLHLDVWTPNGTEFQVRLVNAVGAGQTEATVTYNAGTTPALTTGAWISLDIPLSAFTGLAGRSALGQMLLLVPTSTSGVFYVDNVYFRK
ncbi:MAG: Ig-like domain-containing protein [Anaeromyxobacter sp.]|nr:Ig-like domain-containing protein [Anaeromyxobacter sp.]